MAPGNGKVQVQMIGFAALKHQFRPFFDAALKITEHPFLLFLVHNLYSAIILL